MLGFGLVGCCCLLYAVVFGVRCVCCLLLVRWPSLFNVLFAACFVTCLRCVAYGIASVVRFCCSLFVVCCLFLFASFRLLCVV